MDPTPADLRRQRRRHFASLGEHQHGVVAREQLRAAGITDHELAANLAAGRWRAVGTEAVVMHCGPLPEPAQWWVAVLEGGPRAFLDGESALVAAGLEHYRPRAIRVTVPRGARIRHLDVGGELPVDIRQTRRWCADDVVGTGLPRARVEVATIRAALWAVTPKQAAYLPTTVVQQGLATASALAEEMLRVRRHRFRLLLHGVLLDLLGGVRSLGELQVARECRRRGLPEPDRQVVRRGRNGTYYLDLRWDDWGVVVEVDGIQHTWATQVVGDALRQNDVTLQGDVVLRLPLLGLRVSPDDFFDQIATALAAAGCPLRDVIRQRGDTRRSV